MFSENLDRFKISASEELKLSLQQRVIREKEMLKQKALDDVAAQEATEAAAATEVSCCCDSHLFGAVPD